MLRKGKFSRVPAPRRARTPEPPTETVAYRARRLREALHLSGDAFALACGLGRVEVVQLENGRNKATSYALRDALARGSNVPLEPLAEYLDGKITLSALLSLRGMRPLGDWWRTILANAPRGEATTPVAGSSIVPKAQRKDQTG